MFLWIFIVLSVVFVYIKLVKPTQTWKNRNVPYSKPWPLFGNMGQLVFRQTSFGELIQRLYNECENRYMGMYQFLIPTLIIKDIDLIKQIAVKDFDNFIDHRTFTSEEHDPLFGKNLFALKGQKWRHMRSTLSPAFTSSKMRSMFILIADCAEQFSDYLVKNSDPKSHMTVEMKDLFSRFGNDIIATCAFGLKCDSLKEKENEFYVMGKRATDFNGLKSLKFFAYTISPFLMKFFDIKIFDNEVSDFFRNIVKSTIQTREENAIVRPDMIHLLMQAKKGQLKHEEVKNKNEENTGFATVEESQVGKESRNNQIELTDDDLAAQAILFFFAGFDTISIMMCHMANELALNPNIQERLQKEIDETLEDCKGKISYDFVGKMKYLDMVVCESLRKWPPTPLTDRVCTNNYTIEPANSGEKPLKLYKNDLIWVPIFAIHRDPKYYSNPDKFDPERFSDENKDKIKPMTYIPFGLGPRNCIGSRFALLEAKLIFIHLLSKFDIIIDKKKTEIPLKLNRANFNITAENGFWLGIKLRNK